MVYYLSQWKLICKSSKIMSLCDNQIMLLHSVDSNSIQCEDPVYRLIWKFSISCILSSTPFICCIHQRNYSNRAYLRCPIWAWVRLRCLGVREWWWLCSGTFTDLSWESILIISSYTEERVDQLGTTAATGLTRWTRDVLSQRLLDRVTA